MRRPKFQNLFSLVSLALCMFSTGVALAQTTENTTEEPKPIKRADIELEIERCTHRIDADPNKAENYLDRGVFRCQLDDFNSALEDFKKAVALDGKSDKAYAYRSIANSVARNHNEALSDCVMALRLNPRNLMARTNLPACYSKTGDFRNAVVTGIQNTQLEPHNWIHWTNLAEAYLKGGRYKEAIDCANRAIGRNTKMGGPYYWRSLALEKSGNKKGAKQDLKHSRDLGYEPDSINVTMRENPPDKYKVERKEAIKHRRN